MSEFVVVGGDGEPAFAAGFGEVGAGGEDGPVGGVDPFDGQFGEVSEGVEVVDADGVGDLGEGPRVQQYLVGGVAGGEFAGGEPVAASVVEVVAEGVAEGGGGPVAFGRDEVAEAEVAWELALSLIHI